MACHEKTAQYLTVYVDDGEAVVVVEFDVDDVVVAVACKKSPLLL